MDAAPISRPMGPLRATIASVVLAPTIWVATFCAGVIANALESLSVTLVFAALGYLTGFGLAVWGLLGIPRAGTGGVLGLGILGGVMNALLLTMSVAAALIYYGTYG